MGVKLPVNPIGSGEVKVCDMDLDRLQDVTLQLRENIEKYQEEAYRRGLAFRAEKNRRYNKKNGLEPMYFSEGEYVLLSELENKNKDKSKPVWSGPMQIVQVLSEHLYLLRDLEGKEKERHSSLLIPFAPSEFLPNPATKVAYLLDKGKLEVERIVTVDKEQDGALVFEVKWRGFPDSKNTRQSAEQFFVEVPSMVINFLNSSTSNLVSEVVQYLKLLYPDYPQWNQLNVN